MTTELLDKVVEIINNLGAEGLAAFKWYLGAQIAVALLGTIQVVGGWLVGLLCVCKGIKIVCQQIDCCDARWHCKNNKLDR